MNWKDLYDYSMAYGKPHWGKNAVVEKWIPQDFVSLYTEYDPLKVELPFDGNSMNLTPYKELKSRLEEYGLDKDSLVFATCNGDPYFVNNSKVYTFMHGMVNSSWELIDENIDNFFMEIITEKE